METACELCNNLKTLRPICACGDVMTDSGPVTDFTGPYSPYFNTSFINGNCHHLFTCPACGNDRIIIIRLRKI